MRLICPNCDAQYEVPDEVIPTSGRDVQCSNCGQTWFKYHPDHEPDEDLEAESAAEPHPDEEVGIPVTPSDLPQPEPERRKLDPSVADILRQEAEAEQEARRRRQAETLESQPDLGMDTGNDEDSEDLRARQAKDRMDRMRGIDTADTADAEPTGVAASGVSSRRDLLPDIEEINSTLRSASDRNAVDQHGDDASGPVSQETKAKRGFRRGFVLVIALTAVLMLLYAFAPQIAKAVPMVDPLLTRFVGQIDMLRLWLDGTLDGILQWLDAKASQTSV